MGTGHEGVLPGSLRWGSRAPWGRLPTSQFIQITLSGGRVVLTVHMWKQAQRSDVLCLSEVGWL